MNRGFSFSTTYVLRAKNMPAMQETWGRSLDREDPLEKGMATHSSILARRIPWREVWRNIVHWGHKESDTSKRLTLKHQALLNLLLLCWDWK